MATASSTGIHSMLSLPFIIPFQIFGGIFSPYAWFLKRLENVPFRTNDSSLDIVIAVCVKKGRWSVFLWYVFHFGPSTSLTCALLGTSDTRRTTFVNTLCKSEVLSHKISDSPETAHVEEGIRIKPVNVSALQPQTWFFRAHLLPF